MAEYGRRRRALRRLGSLLSVAGTTVGVAATTSGSVPCVNQPVAAAYRQGRSSPTAEATAARVAVSATARAGTPASTAPAAAAPGAAAAPTSAAPTGGEVPAATALADAPPVTASPPVTPSPPVGSLAAPTGAEGSSGGSTATITSDGASGEASAGAASAPWCERVGQAALAQVSYPWHERLPGWTISFQPGRAGLLGGTWTYERRIEIYVRDGQDVDDVAFTLAHELGHAVDVGLLSDADRQRWIATRGIAASVPWWVESGATDFSSGSGDWAEAFAVWQVGGVSHSRIAAAPSAADLAVVAQLSRPGG